MSGFKSAGGTARFVRGLRDINKTTVKVGITEPKLHANKGNPIDMAWLYHRLDQGPVGRKRKSWPTLHPGMMDAELEHQIRSTLTKAAVGQGAIGLNKVGHSFQQSVIKQIKTIRFPVLEEETIVAKGHGKPLIETRQLRKSITYKLVK